MLESCMIFDSTGVKNQVCPHSECLFSTGDPASLTRHRKRKHNYVPKPRRKWCDKASAFVTENEYPTSSRASTEVQGPITTPTPSPTATTSESQPIPLSTSNQRRRCRLSTDITSSSSVVGSSSIVDSRCWRTGKCAFNNDLQCYDNDSVLCDLIAAAATPSISSAAPGRDFSLSFDHWNSHPESTTTIRQSTVFSGHRYLDVEAQWKTDDCMPSHCKADGDGRPYNTQQEGRAEHSHAGTHDERDFINTTSATTSTVTTTSHSILSSPSLQQTPGHTLPTTPDTSASPAAHHGFTTHKSVHNARLGTSTTSPIRGSSTIQLPSISSWYPSGEDHIDATAYFLTLAIYTTLPIRPL
ncbi:hypothetical protein PM082_013820 [Marasmius tenuissimus]|nr:hypothetical protein PM082_013820 [Marasmius tenuissimus]